MPHIDVSRDGEAAAGREVSREPVTRERLYELAWSEPMIRVGERFGVSSSYMARVCADLRVPRPGRGYWAQREFGKEPPTAPSLPAARPGDVTVWSPGSALSSPRIHPARTISERLDSAESGSGGGVRIMRTEHKRARGLHELLTGVKPDFLKTRKTEAGLLRPYKRRLVDIIVSEKQVDVALAAANSLFVALETKGHRVTFSPPDARMRRAEFDEREAPNKNHYHHAIWSPDRITVVYVGNVPIGLTLFETTEEIEVVYDHGTYLPVRDLSAVQLRQYQGPMHWRTKQRGPSGRFCWQAYCPNWMVKWTRQWRGSNAKEMESLVSTVLQDLEAAAPVLANQVAEAEARAEAQRREWEEESRRRREEEQRRIQAKRRQDAKDDLLTAIDAWERARRVQEWLALVEREAQDLADADRQQVLARLQEAKALVGDSDALALLKRWKAPSER